MSDPNRYPPGWNRERVEKVIEYYENQSDEEAAAEDEAYWNEEGYSALRVPNEIIPEVEALIEAHEARKAS